MANRIAPETVIGLKFGRLTVVAYSHQNKYHKSVFRCLCECGTEIEVVLAGAVSGNTTSCGCYLKQRIRESNTTHGLTGSPEYGSWAGMKDRCFNVNDPKYPDYGGRGITVCERWRKFENFLADMGPRPSLMHSVDRFPDQNGNYEPSNCRWATSKDQARNTRRNVLYSFGTETLCQTEWAELFEMPIKSLRRRLDQDWTIEEALATPNGKVGANHKRRATRSEFLKMLASVSS